MSRENPRARSEDVDVSEVDEIDLDSKAAKPFRAVFENGLIAYFQDEDSACLFQRMWRDVTSAPKQAIHIEDEALRALLPLSMGDVLDDGNLSIHDADGCFFALIPPTAIMGTSMEKNIASEIIDAMNQRIMPSDVISRIETWQRDAGRRNAFDVAQVSKHVGYQLAEMAELLDALNMSDDQEIAELRARIDGMATLFKTGGKIASNPNRQEIVDASCDLTVFGVAQMMVCGYKPLVALDEVQRSNDSKRFPDGSLRKSEHGKILKSDAFFKPNLALALVSTSDG